MAMSFERLSRLAAAEDQGSVAAGAMGINVMLLEFYRQSERHAALLGRARESAAASDEAVVSTIAQLVRDETVLRK